MCNHLLQTTNPPECRHLPNLCLHYTLCCVLKGIAACATIHALLASIVWIVVGRFTHPLALPTVLDLMIRLAAACSKTMCNVCTALALPMRLLRLLLPRTVHTGNVFAMPPAASKEFSCTAMRATAFGAMTIKLVAVPALPGPTYSPAMLSLLRPLWPLALLLAVRSTRNLSPALWLRL